MAAARRIATLARSMSTSAASSGGKKLWGGRFTGATDPLMDAFNASLHTDKRLFEQDIKGSIAYAQALARCGLLKTEEAEALKSGLQQVLGEWKAGTFVVKDGDEDIHTANERRLGEIVGSVAGKLHTGRSRNDQVATDVRLWVKCQLTAFHAVLLSLIRTAVERAEAEIDYIMPGYTHLQPAQPVRWSHWLLSHAWAWQRDTERLVDTLHRVDASPLGSGAIAGHAFRIDREALAKDMGFQRVTENSMDSVSDRDFIVDTLSWAALLSIHLSRWAEDLIIYGSAEFGYVTLSDAYSTGSSLMPQKKNPDALELLRGKSGRVVGNLNTLHMVLKGTPSTYNKDLQEDKEPLFDTFDTIWGTVPIATGVLATLTVNPDRMRRCLVPEMLATDLADYLVRRGVPFRETHHVAGAAVRLAETTKRKLWDLSVTELKTLHPAFEEDVKHVWSFTSSVEARDSIGGTSKRAVQEQIAKLRTWLDASSRAMEKEQ